jgi:4Fe-4S ferredoxin
MPTTDAAALRARAATHPRRPGQNCQAPPATFQPLVNRASCEGKSACAAVCPYDVFEISRIAPADYAPLPWLAKLKLRFHGLQTAYTPRADQCQACGLCVVACPEDAITLVERATL